MRDESRRATEVRGALLIYGATGYMGGLTVRAAVRHRLRPIVAARSDRRLLPIAREFDLEARIAPLSDPAALDQALRGVAVLLNAAGPFSQTSSPLVEACLRCGVHYLDLAGEVAVFEGIRARGAQARQRGTMLLPGVGFDVVPSDCLAAYVTARLPGARTLRLAISGLELMSRGSARTLAEQVGRPPLVRRRGRLVPIAAGSLEHTFDYGAGDAPSVAVSWGDLASAFTTTAIPNIETYFEATPMVRAAVAASRFAGPLLSSTPAQAMLQALTAALPDGPDDEERQTHAAVIVAEAEDSAGSTMRARLRTPEAYTLSADTSVAAAADVLAGNFEAGYQTPAGLYGADYILQFPGVVREELSPAAAVGSAQ